MRNYYGKSYQKIYEVTLLWKKTKKKNWFVNISEYHHRTMGLLSHFSLVYTMQFCKQWCYTNTRKHLQLALKCIFKDSLKWHLSWKWTINLQWRCLHCVKKIEEVNIICSKQCGSGFLLHSSQLQIFIQSWQLLPISSFFFSFWLWAEIPIHIGSNK